MNKLNSLPRFGHWINGEPFVEPDADYRSNYNPLDRSPICEFSQGTPSTIDIAVTSAAKAFEDYRLTNVSTKEKYLLRAAELLEQSADLFVDLLIDEIGSPISKAKREVASSIGILRAAAGATRQITGKTYPTDHQGRLSTSFRVPLGVIAGMTPFNVPLIKAIKHSAMPLATGNTVVLLPSEETPCLAIEVAKLYEKAGFPPGVFNIVLGNGAEIGDSLTTHPLVRMVGFTGSQRVGRHVQKLCGEHGKRVMLELGGKNPLIVLNDADLEKTIPACLVGSFLYQGQICMSSSRIIVQNEIYDRFLEAFIPAVNRLQLGDLRDERTLIGPIINSRQIERIEEHIQDALCKGAMVASGNSWKEATLKPTVLTEVNAQMKIYSEETFGPVTTLFRVGSVEEALGIANDTEFGLCGSVFTNQLDRALEFANRLDAGMVHINATTIQEEPHVPFGGVKQSGFGREGSQVGIDELTEWKWVTIQ